MNPIFFAASLLLSLYTTTVLAVENKNLLDRVVAIINSEPILLSDLKLVEKNLSKPGLIDETLITPYKMEDLKANTKAQLNYLINEKILSTEIKKLNLSVSAERVEQEITSMAKRAGASKEDLLNAIRAQGISLLEYKTFLKDKIEKQSLVQQEVISKIRISDDEILNEYMKTNKKNNNKVNEFSLAHVFFNPNNSSEKSPLDRANAAYQKIKSGQSFESAAEQYTEDPLFENNGFLGHFKAGEFLPEIESKILTMNIGEVTPPLKTKKGIHIFKLLDKKMTVDSNFEKEKEKISSVLLEKAFRAQLPIWLESKKIDASIIINEK